MKMENVEDVYPLSPTQEGMLFHTLNAPKSGVYFNQYTCILYGDLNVSAFKKAWQQVVDRHPVLRAAFLWEGLDEPLQVVRQQVKIYWEDGDWQDLSPIEGQARLRAFLQADRERGFQLAQAPLMRLALIQLNQDTHQFIWSFHHLLSDGWSTHLLLKEVFAFYEALYRRKNLHLKRPRPYRDYIAWLQQKDLSKAEIFWRQILKDFTSPTSLKVERGRWKVDSDEDFPSSLGGSYDKQQIALSEATTAALQSIARDGQLTLNTLVQGVWALLLSRYSGENDVVFGITVSGRPADLVGVEEMVGLFINTLPVRVQVSSEDLVLPWLKEIQAQQVETRQYEYSPLVEVQGWSDLPRGVPLFESIVVFENYPLAASLQEQDSSLEIRDVRYLERSNYPLAVLAVPGPQLQLIIIYNCSRFDAAVITRMLGHLRNLLEGIAANPNQCLLDLPIVTKAERHQLLVEWNQTEAEAPRNQCWNQLFEAQVERTPEAVAVVCGNRRLSYRELNCQANQLAHYLRGLGVGPDVLVGIYVERSLEMVVGLLGILKAGGAYVPLDPDYPKDRLAFMLEDAQVSVLLTQNRLATKLPDHKAKLVSLDADPGEAEDSAKRNWQVIRQQSTENLENDVTVENLAYVIYTSGSTGQPKGVMITHQNLVHSTVARIKFYVQPIRSFLLLSSFAFDSSVAGIFWTLCQGGTLCIPEENLHKDTSYLAGLIQQNNVSHLLCVPSLYQHLLATERSLLRSLTTVIVAGEVCPVGLVKAHFTALSETSLFNEYGPTETTVWSTVFDCRAAIEATTVPIGRPIANAKIYVLDAALQPVPVGVPGELYIGGAGVACGYLNRPELTDERFIPNPFGEDHLYRTGDLVRYLADGNLEFLGRNDHQVKIRGYRIELDEIESVLTQHPAVKQAVVVAKGKSDKGAGSIDHQKTEDLAMRILSLGPEKADELITSVENLGFFNTVKYGGEDNLTLFSRQTPPVSGKNAEKHL